MISTFEPSRDPTDRPAATLPVVVWQEEAGLPQELEMFEYSQAP